MRGFEFLPVLLLPRMRNALTAFFSAGILFEGDQFPLNESWFKIYPGIAEVLLFYFGSLNLLAKLLRRRVTDVLFGPTLFILCVMHWMRFELTGSGWYGFDGRVPTAITANEIDSLSLWKLATTKAALRIGGSITPLLSFKLGLLAINTLPLLVGDCTSIASHRVRSTPTTPAEQILGVRASTSAGLGRCPSAARLLGCTLQPFELTRLGYVVADDALILPISDWLLLLLILVVLRPIGRGYSFRVLVIPVSVAWTSSSFTISLPSLQAGAEIRYLRSDNDMFQTMRLGNLAILPLL